MPVVFDLPDFLQGRLTREQYVRWLQRKAIAHVRRDRRRWNREISVASYKAAIHAAVLRSDGRDYYTGEPLRWDLVSRYDNQASRLGGSSYKRRFELLPTVDHVDPDSRDADFEICGWRTNDCKNDLAHDELRRFCKLILDNV
jgi:hypothetical protein